MNNLTTDQLIRYSKITLMAFLSFFGLLVMYSNIIDYSSNYEYVSHILSMDTTRENLNISYRAIVSPMLHHRVYWIIITLEVIYTTCCLIGTYQLFKHRNASIDVFHEAKKLSIIGLLIAIFVYYVCMQVIGVEWFNMDESQVWNAKDWARHIIDFIVPLLIYLTLKIEH
ncbi:MULTISPECIES: DUF2165 domain-containing protein [unclassified Pseudomonas]|uniref:DUF2165 domain-containing protein n=1 Tax=unclassified Pseudomonas TaxID=196821 RepID=UPI002AC983FC|nr:MULTISPECIES: DUF2165 domain-containing protein [unclassified Pseudomonas]MEB0044326.1 DUF2165 domain-containing protein [Pseudomonas sp. Dout3]MEB0094737.1 DUF2165 domain-containing protein [Pseudomonas sp. DC1.2]WPX59897.1 DUF2165 domain-containing protein [Pseudomonas sp. DC1.2]